jgi:sulfur relay (sulfurtransferase) complex TusBCD TusD component (DsrE family)
METDYLLIASRDPYTHEAARRCYELAAQLADEGCRVTLFLVQNGVLTARPSSSARKLTELARQGVRVLADDLSLRERGIERRALAAGVAPAALDTVVDALERGARVLWH